jgi:hypothetical protein
MRGSSPSGTLSRRQLLIMQKSTDQPDRKVSKIQMGKGFVMLRNV